MRVELIGLPSGGWEVRVDGELVRYQPFVELALLTLARVIRETYAAEGADGTRQGDPERAGAPPAVPGERGA